MLRGGMPLCRSHKAHARCLADHRVSRDPAEFSRDLRVGKLTRRAQIAKHLFAFFCPLAPLAHFTALRFKS